MIASEPAGVCHVCLVAGKAGERWITADTCDACTYLDQTVKFGNTQDAKDRARQQLRAAVRVEESFR